MQTLHAIRKQSITPAINPVSRFQWSDTNYGQFDGVDDYVSIDSISTDDGGYFGACTIRARVEVTNPASTLAVCCLGSGAYRIFTQDSEWRLIGTTTGEAVTAGVHVVEADFNEAGTAVAFRLNGETVWTGTISAGGTDGVRPFYIGARAFSGSLGLYWDSKIYDVELSGSNVANFHLPFSEKSGTTVRDVSGNGNDGTANNISEATFWG